jgi:hypothetical protein
VLPQALASSLVFFFSVGLSRISICDSATISGLSLDLVAIGIELVLDRLVGLADILFLRGDQMQQHAGALDMAEEAVADADAFMRAFDQARNVGQNEFAWRRSSPRRDSGCSVVKG